MIDTGSFSQTYLKPEGAERLERERRARLERDSASLIQRAPELGAELLQVFETLPQALASAAKAELKRLRERHGEEHPRVRDAALALEQLQSMALEVDGGSARARRLLEFSQLDGAQFHGVVADTSGRPLAGVGVRIEFPRGQEPRQTCSEDDGYFRIPLPRVELRPEGGKAQFARVRLLHADGQLAQADPLPLDYEGSSVYREYRIEPPRGCEGKSPDTPSYTPDDRPKPPPASDTRPPKEPTPLAGSTPLEHVRGIGPTRAAALRNAGIVDLEALLASDADRLVEVLGFDIGPTRDEAERVLAEYRRQREGDAGGKPSTARTPAGKQKASSRSTPSAAAEPEPKQAAAVPKRSAKAKPAATKAAKAATGKRSGAAASPRKPRDKG